MSEAAARDAVTPPPTDRTAARLDYAQARARADQAESTLARARAVLADRAEQRADQQ